MKIIQNEKCEVTVERPDGTIETLTHPKITRMNDRLWAQLKAAMLNTGKGKAISYRNHEESDYLVHCGRCGQQIDRRTAAKRGMDFFCTDCRQVLMAVGAGERSEWEQITTAPTDNTPEHKQD